MLNVSVLNFKHNFIRYNSNWIPYVPHWMKKQRLARKRNINLLWQIPRSPNG
uniref:Uncharacterized protein n=1 Tax=Elaeophora elaphi TaxID=1147741 RepID=A0A0R3RNH9_9BILA